MEKLKIADKYLLGKDFIKTSNGYAMRDFSVAELIEEVQEDTIRAFKEKLIKDTVLTHQEVDALYQDLTNTRPF